jgi:stalled ribosome rescue protein Dom34
MKREAGLWIDHRQAVIVTFSGQAEVIKRIVSNMEKHVRYSGVSHPKDQTESHNDAAEDIRDRRFDNHLNTFYDEVIACLSDVDAILILGPGEAKVELQKRLEAQEPSGRIVAIEAADKMTDGQIAAQIRQHFRG